MVAGDQNVARYLPSGLNGLDINPEPGIVAQILAITLNLLLDPGHGSDVRC